MPRTVDRAGEPVMTMRSVWRSAMYGGFAGAALGLLSMIVNWTSPQPGSCALQFASMVGCGIGAGLVVAFGPVRTIRWALGVHRADATGKDLAKRVALLAVVTSLGVALLAAAWQPDFRLQILLFAWVAALLTLMAAKPRTWNTPGRRWGLAACIALAAVYGPFVVAAVNTWWTDGSSTWWRADMLKHVLLVPGGVILEFASAAIWHRHPNLSPACLFVLAGLLSAMLIVATAWLATRSQWWRWITLALLAGLSAFGAIVVDAVLRA
jgi:hypothetical protein